MRMLHSVGDLQMNIPYDADFFAEAFPAFLLNSVQEPLKTKKKDTLLCWSPSNEHLLQ